MSNFDNIFFGKTILITGNTGFMGTWLTLWLSLLGARVVGYSIDNPSHNYVIKHLIRKNKIHQIINDINNYQILNSCIEKYEPEFIFHLAAQPIVRTSYEQPVLTFQTNIMGTVNVLESIRHHPSVRTCIIVTSDKSYENKEIDYAYKESDPMGGHDPYSASKAAAELVTSSYRNSFFNSNKDNIPYVSTVRAGNIIGGGDWSDYRIIPDCMNSLISDKSIQVRNSTSIRPWQYVLEPISGLLLLAQKMQTDSKQFSSSWNFGPDISLEKITVKNLVELIILEWGSGTWSDVSENSNHLPHEAKYLMLDSSKSKQYLGWNPVYSLKEAIHETVDWYKINSNSPENMYDYSLKQIENYVKKAQKLDMV